MAQSTIPRAGHSCSCLLTCPCQAFVRSINTILAIQAPFIITSQLVLFPLAQRMEESQIQTLRLQFDELCWLGSSQPEASGTFPSIEYVASLNMVLTQGRCVMSSS